MKPAFDAYRGHDPYVFLSYAQANEKIVIHDADWLNDNGVRIWYDGEIRGGREWEIELNDRIRECCLVLLCLSDACFRKESATRSESYVYKEIDLAKRFRKRLLIVTLEPLDLPARIAHINKWQMFRRYEMSQQRYRRLLLHSALDTQLEAQRGRRWSKLFNAKARSFGALQGVVETIDKTVIRGFLTPTLTDGLELDPPMTVHRSATNSSEWERDLSRKKFYLKCGAAPRLLITGGPGSGKSIQMLKFVDELLPRGGRLEHDSKIPIVLNASSWIDDPIQKRKTEKTFRSWVEAQLLLNYGIPRATSSDLIENYQFIYCIDGFDELGRHGRLPDEKEQTLEKAKVEEERCRALRAGFLAELEPFMKSGLGATTGLILCSRTTAADQILARDRALKFCEVRINDLDNAVVFDIVRRNELKALMPLTKRPNMDEMLSTPLGLQMLAMVFKNQEDLTTDTPEASREHVYKQYLGMKLGDFVITRDTNDAKTRANLDLKKEMIRQFTCGIARYLVNRGGDLTFRFDALQPNELPPNGYPMYRKFAALMVIGGIFVCAAVPVGIAVGTDRYFAGEGISALGYGALTTVSIGLAGGVAAFGYWRFTGAWAGAFIGVAFAIGRAFGVGLSARVPGSDSSFRGALLHGTASLAIVPVFALLFYLVKENPLQIIPIETWETDQSKAFVAVLATSIAFGIVFGKILGPARGIAFGVCLGIAMGTRFARRERQAPLKITPNQAIDYTRKVAVTNSVGITGASMMVFGVTYGMFFDRREGVNNAVLAGTFLVSFFFFGGLSVLKHFALRRTLRKLKMMPRADIRFLEVAAQAGLMRQVGGSFVFPHPTMTQYFAEQNTTSTWGRGKVVSGNQRRLISRKERL